jgi:hypothetical protein
MTSLNLDLDELLEGMTRDGMKKFVRKLLTAGAEEEKKLLKKLDAGNDLADLDEEMHGKHSAPEVTDEDMPGDGALADVPKKKGKK